MSFIDSKNVQVYPSAFRGKVDGTGALYNPESRLPSEFNVTNLNKQYKYQGFIISATNTSVSGTTLWDLEFNIAGYYFKINDLDLDSVINWESDVLANARIFAHIKVGSKNAAFTESANNTDWPVISLIPIETSSANDPLDVNNKFIGIEFIGRTVNTNLVNTEIDKYLLLFTKTGIDYNTAYQSRIKLTTAEIANATGGNIELPLSSRLNTEDIYAENLYLHDTGDYAITLEGNSISIGDDEYRSGISLNLEIFRKPGTQDDYAALDLNGDSVFIYTPDTSDLHIRANQGATLEYGKKDIPLHKAIVGSSKTKQLDISESSGVLSITWADLPDTY